MKPRGIKDFYLPAWIAYHLKLILGSAFISMIFMLIMTGSFQKSVFLQMFPMVFIQFEVFIWLGKKFFLWFPVTRSRSPGQIISGNIIRLIAFYILVLFIAFIVFIGSLLIQSNIYDTSPGILLKNFLESESKGFFIASGAGMLVGTIVFFYFQWQDSLRREQKLREENLIFKYETLKNQVNPHFLFNSLNTLSSLVGSQPEAAENYISKLSSTYRYVLENKDKDLVELIDELKFAAEYFFLQKIRDGEKIRLISEISSAEQYKIIPISLQILFENVFKHNSATPESPLTIKMTLDDQDRLVVSNPVRKKTTLEKSTGIGLKNLGERVRLITGKGIEITENGEFFIVRIPLVTSKQKK